MGLFKHFNGGNNGNDVNNGNTYDRDKVSQADMAAKYKEMSWSYLATQMVGDGLPRYLVMGIPDSIRDARRLRVLPNITFSLNNIITVLHNHGVQILDVNLTQSNEPREYKGMHGQITGAFNNYPDNRTKSGEDNFVNLYVILKYRYNAQR